MNDQQHSSADALTDEFVKRAFYAADCGTWYEMYPSAAMDVAREILAASPVEQPEQDDGVPECNGSHDAGQIAAGDAECTACAGEHPAPSPADERATLPEMARKAFAMAGANRWHLSDPPMAEAIVRAVLDAHATSANETGAEAVAIPAGWKLVRVNEHFDALIAALERAESKGYLPDSMREEWENFACDENVTQPAPKEATMTSKLTERQRMDLLLVADDMSVSGDAALADALRALLAPTQQPSGEVTFERWRDSMSVNWWGNVTPIQAAAAAFNAARAQGGES